MQDCIVQSDKKLLGKLRRKAELCRFAHSEEKEKFKRYRNWKEFAVVLFSIISAGLIGFYFRDVLEGGLVLSTIFIFSLGTALLQALDHTVFQWTHKLARHESAVAIWGVWIREADFVEKRIQRFSSDLMNEKMNNLQEKYNNCMSSTEQIPNNKFLKYKKNFHLYKSQSKELDQITSDD